MAEIRFDRFAPGLSNVILKVAKRFVAGIGSGIGLSLEDGCFCWLIDADLIKD